ncbi:nucleolar protein 16-like isoform X1 [Oppia nitens]|uniref:nucleolar protein 16-like isoform X1 n=1 Tax=Oppia nitens TaxID=1686743 RepID=UPI0023D9AAAE|nr:nucleolar protein 16-like isoform X1 [Oppia nitens]
MSKAKGVSKRRKATKRPNFVHKTKLKRQRNKILKKTVKIECKSIRDSIDKKKNLTINFTAMGLSLNPNKTLAKVGTEEQNEIKNSKRKEVKNKSKDNLKKTKVIEELEAEASKEIPKKFKFGPINAKFCVYMIEKYGDNYEAMARDPINYYQESVGQIRQKIKKFKAIPSNWNSYLEAKKLIETQDTNDIYYFTRNEVANILHL